MKVLILGSGGREHAFAWKLLQSPEIERLYIAPGNAGTALCGQNVALSPVDFKFVGDFVLQNNIGLVLVGPEDPLVCGIVDFFKTDKDLKKIMIIGPGKDGARLEGSKDFAKQFMNRYNIPTARHKTFSSSEYNKAIAFLNTLQPPYVLKADGLAAGKGVLILQELSEAVDGLESMLLQKKFGEAGNTVVIEEFLQGIELSVFVATDGLSYKILPGAKDYKRIGEGDTGPNTGGMGAVSPVPFADTIFMQKVEEKIIKPTITGLQLEKISYHGFIFFGLMNVNGDPYVIEYNVRMGDPETEAILPRIKTDFLDILKAITQGKLDEINMEIDDRTSATIILVSGGYPGNFEKGKIISGHENITGSLVFHAGTARDANDNLITIGGRVMAITSLHQDLGQAISLSVEAIGRVQFDGKCFRKDIGGDLFKYQK